MQKLSILSSIEQSDRRWLGFSNCLTDADLRQVSSNNASWNEIPKEENANGDNRSQSISMPFSGKYRSPENDAVNDVISDEKIDDIEEPKGQHEMVAGTHCPDALSESGNNTACSSGSLEFDTTSDDDDGEIAGRILHADWKCISDISSTDKTPDTSYNRNLSCRNLDSDHCTEGLGSESSEVQQVDSVQKKSFQSQIVTTSDEEESVFGEELAHCADSIIENSQRVQVSVADQDQQYDDEFKASKFPPPLSYAERAGPPSNSFSLFLRPHRKDGRFVLEEVRVPRREYLRASRRDGRLKLELVRQNDDENFARPQASLEY